MAECRSCRAPIRWVVTAATGKRMPIDADPTPDGNIVVTPDDVAHYLTADAVVPEGVNRYVSHFATCPNARTHRRPT